MANKKIYLVAALVPTIIFCAWTRNYDKEARSFAENLKNCTPTNNQKIIKRHHTKIWHYSEILGVYDGVCQVQLHRNFPKQEIALSTSCSIPVSELESVSENIIKQLDEKKDNFLYGDSFIESKYCLPYNPYKGF